MAFAVTFQLHAAPGETYSPDAAEMLVGHPTRLEFGEEFGGAYDGHITAAEVLPDGAMQLTVQTDD